MTYVPGSMPCSGKREQAGIAPSPLPAGPAPSGPSCQPQRPGSLCPVMVLSKRAVVAVGLRAASSGHT